jgi:hydrogenase maturation protein HypF
METMEFYEETFSRFKQLFMFEPQIAVCDMHTDYLSTKFAESLNIELIKVQHHHAHISSCMLENGIDEKVIGVSLDGTGYGTDGNIWGGEFMIADLNDFQRCYHFDYLALPGGDLVTKQPWRTGISMLYRSFGNEIFDLDIEIINRYENKIDLLIQAIDKKINTPLGSSAGRLFDAVSSLLGLCYESKFHAEAPMRLESFVDKNISQSYNYTIDNDIIKFDDMLFEMIDDIKNKVDVSIISAKFHNLIIDITYDLIHRLSDEYGLKTAALSGGTFQNKYLLEKLEYKFLNSHIRLLTQSKVPSNDGGIALGQLAIGAKRREMKCV